MNPIEVGIAGFGDGGPGNLKSMLSAGVKIVAICDSNKNVLKKVKDEPGSGSITLYSSVQDLLAGQDVDLVVVATPDDQHLLPVQMALEAGKYVFVEKPVATTLDDLLAFKNLAVTYPDRILFSEKYSFAYPVQAALAHREELGAFLYGTTFYSMENCDRIMGSNKWRTESAYNPCAGGLSHNFMVALLFTSSPITRVRATGQVLSYHENLDMYGGYDTMEGTLEFASGKRLNWSVCLAMRGAGSLFGHRTVAHMFQFEHGSLVYGSMPESDQLIVGSQSITLVSEPEVEKWNDYNLYVLYRRMHRDLIRGMISGDETRHTIWQGINVAHACCLAFESAKLDGEWISLSS